MMKRASFVAGSLAAASVSTSRLSRADAGDAFPFDFAQGVIVLAVDVGLPKPARMIFDTGNTPLVLDTDRARGLGLAVPSGAKRTSGQGSSAFDFYRVTLPTVGLGATRLRDQPALLVPFSDQVKHDYGIEVDGSFGYGALRDRVVRIDFPARELRISTAPGAAAAGSVSSPITWLQYQPQSPRLITFDGLTVDGEAVTAQLDTFLAREAIVFTAKTPRFAHLPDAPAKPIEYEGATLRPARVGAVSFLSETLGRAPITVYVAGKGAHVPTTAISAILGNALLADRVVELDFPNSTITLAPAS